MTPTIPPDAERVVLAAVVPCAWLDADMPACENNKHGECAHYEDDVCNGDGTRTVVTDIEVRQACIAEEGMYEEFVWREVER